MLTLEAFRDALRAMIGSDLPECVDASFYNRAAPLGPLCPPNQLQAMWARNPARAFLRLTDPDQAKVLQEIRGPK